MAKDKRISDLPGISNTVTVALNRMGLLTASDLVNAEFDRVAVVIEDFNEAARLVREARQVADPKKVKEGPSAAAPEPLAAGGSSHAQRTALRISSASKPAAVGKVAANVNAAMALATAVESAPNWRTVLSRRLNAATILLAHEATQSEIAACMALESAESGELGRSGVKLGADVDGLLEECISLRTVPVLPSGKLPRYYLEMARTTSQEARRVCAAALLATLRAGQVPERADLQAEALAAGGPEPLVAELVELITSGRVAA